MELLEFEDKVKKIFFYSCRYGVYTLFNGEKPTDNFDTKELNRLCLDGFKIAQKMIVSELKELLKTRKDNDIEIKKAKRERNKSLDTELTDKRKLLNYQSDIFRNLADTIAWQMLNGQHYLYRRLFTHETGEKNLNDKSFACVIDFADKVNTDSDSFCLITDITNNIQLGDCLIVDREGIKISEIKSGEINHKALDYIRRENLNEENFSKSQLKETFDDGFAEQVERMLIQKGKTTRAATIIRDNKGVDPKFKNTNVKIVESDFSIETYHSTLVELIKKLDEKDWAYDCVEAIVHVGIYKNNWRIYGYASMQDTCKSFPFSDLISGRGMMICEPVFLKPFTDEQIIDIVIGRMKILIGIDFDMLIEFANYLGIKASWSTSKELHKYLNSKLYNPVEIFSYKNKGIKLNINGQDMFLGRGFFTKIIYDNILPSTMILKYQKEFGKENLTNLSKPC
jgi:hypothetical protein